MDVQYWPDPVDVSLDEGRHRRTITASCFATECLLTLWPERRGPAYFTALKACTEAMNGLEDHATARRAFIDAAREASVLSFRE